MVGRGEEAKLINAMEYYNGIFRGILSGSIPSKAT